MRYSDLHCQIDVIKSRPSPLADETHPRKKQKQQSGKSPEGRSSTPQAANEQTARDTFTTHRQVPERPSLIFIVHSSKLLKIF